MDKIFPPSRNLSSQIVSIIIILSEAIDSINFRVSSSLLPTPTKNLSQIGRIEVIASITG